MLMIKINETNFNFNMSDIVKLKLLFHEHFYPITN